LKISNGMIGFQRSEWLAGTPARQEAAATPALPISVSTQVEELGGFETELRSAAVNGIKNSRVNGHANGATFGH
jgi:hypothetical protein